MRKQIAIFGFGASLLALFLWWIALPQEDAASVTKGEGENASKSDPAIHAASTTRQQQSDLALPVAAREEASETIAPDAGIQTKLIELLENQQAQITELTKSVESLQRQASAGFADGTDGASEIPQVQEDSMESILAAEQQQMLGERARMEESFENQLVSKASAELSDALNAEMNREEVVSRAFVDAECRSSTCRLQFSPVSQESIDSQMARQWIFESDALGLSSYEGSFFAEKDGTLTFFVELQ